MVLVVALTARNAPAKAPPVERPAAEGVSMATALSTLYHPADAFVAWLACDGGPWQLVCSASTEELCRQRLADWAAIHQPCEVRVMRTGTKPQRRPTTNRRKPKV